MTVLIAGSSLPEATSHSAYAVSDTTASRLAPNCYEGVEITYKNLNGDTLDLSLQTPTQIASGAVSFYMYMEDAASTSNWGYNVVNLMSDTGLSFLRVYNVINTSNYEVYYADADSGEATETLPVLSTGLTRWDIVFDIKSDGTGFFAIYHDGVLFWSKTGQNNGRGTLFDQIRWVRTGGSSSHKRTISAFMIADESTVNLHVAHQVPTGAGSVNDWSGTYANIDGPGQDDGDFMSTEDLNQEALFTFDALPAGFAGYSLEYMQAFVVGINSNYPLDAIARTGGTTYDMGEIEGVNSAVQAVFDMTENPATLAAWTIAEIDAAEFGFKTVSAP